MQKAKTQQEPCPCMRDPFASLPPGLKPRSVEKESSLRKVTCPTCGKVYWTNRKVDICFDCEKGIMNSCG